MNRISILQNKCVGCRVCTKKCPFGAITVENKKAVILDNCTLCRACISSCKFGALYYDGEESKTHEISEFKGIWVFVEHKNGEISAVSLELISKARALADELCTDACAILLGHRLDKLPEKLASYGADNVYVVEHPLLEHQDDKSYSKVIVDMVRQYKPEIFLIGATTYGRSLAPKISAALNTGLTADCTQLHIDTDRRLLLQTRPAFGGNLMATIICPDHRPQMATVRPGVFSSGIGMDRNGNIIRLKYDIPESGIEILESIQNSSDTFDFKKADIIVAAGKGMGKSENLRLVEELASLLGGAVGASRSIVDAGWIDRSHQVGQSGKNVSPKLYIACGISGAIQHMVGLSSSSIIVAINKNPEAPIMKAANYAIVGDVLEVLPALIKRIKARR